MTFVGLEVKRLTLFLMKILILNIVLLGIIDTLLESKHSTLVIRSVEPNTNDSTYVTTLNTETKEDIVHVQRYPVQNISDSSNVSFPHDGYISRPTVTGKSFIFIGYREHWPNRPPYQCDCRNSTISVSKLEFWDDLSNTSEADCLIFSLAARGRIRAHAWHTLRRNRPNGQLWIMASRESATTAHQQLAPPKKYRTSTYNQSFSFHSRADFPTPYGTFATYKTRPRGLERSQDLTELMDRKENLIYWMSSSCGFSKKIWKRTEFARIMSNVLPLHMYGSCGNMTCTKASRECSRTLSSYKFALALENSCCSEYITEKFWNALRLEQVPVVFGAPRRDYERLAPPNSFIHLEDFSNLTQLVAFLHRVDQDDSLYLKYHEWRHTGSIELARLPRDFVSSCHSICRMADDSALLRSKKEYRSHFDPFGDTWYGSCRNCDQIARVFRT